MTTDKITITQYDRRINPEHPNYDEYIAVTFSTGTRVRIVKTTERKLIEQIFLSDDYDTVYDNMVLDGYFKGNIDKWVSIWLDVIMDELATEPKSWDSELIYNDA